MTVTTNPPAASGANPPARADLVNLTVDGFEISVPKGTLVIRAAEFLGIQVPRFCEHPLLDPVGACRQCLVEVEGQKKPMASCTTTVTEGMVVKTQITSAVAEKAQNGVIELLLVNHPLDCPVCDKGGECPLQNQTMTNGYSESRFRDVKRTYPKPIAISAQVLLDRERCVLCTRCTRFAQQIAGDPFIEMLERSALEQVAVYEDQPFNSYFSGNTVQICPVGALTGTQYRFRARPFDLVSSPSICEHCASGCQQRNDHRRGKMVRRLAGVDPQVNEEWNCDKGRWAFSYATAPDRLDTPLVRDATATSFPRRGPRRCARLRPGSRLRVTGRCRRAGRRSPDRRGCLRLREVRPRRAGHQRHRLSRPRALRRRARIPGLARRRPLPRRHLRRPRSRIDRAARRPRARGRVADHLLAAAQGRVQEARQGRVDRAVCNARSRQDARPLDRDGARRRSDHAAVLASGETVEVPPGVDAADWSIAAHRGGGRPCASVERDRRGRAAGGRARWVLCRCRVGRRDRREARVGSAAGR